MDIIRQGGIKSTLFFPLFHSFFKFQQGEFITKPQKNLSVLLASLACLVLRSRFVVQRNDYTTKGIVSSVDSDVFLHGVKKGRRFRLPVEMVIVNLPYARNLSWVVCHF